jgi:hypothetical protein
MPNLHQPPRTRRRGPPADQRAETRARRIEKFVAMLAAGERLY